jgi:hypothetical protein
MPEFWRIPLHVPVLTRIAIESAATNDVQRRSAAMAMPIIPHRKEAVMFPARFAAIVVVGLFPWGSQAGPFTHAERKAAASPSAYSRWHYWTPTLYRWTQHFHPATVPLYPTDRYPGVPNPAGMAVYPNPAVPPEAYYRGTGLSYDVLAPIVVRPPAVLPEK